MAFTVIVVAGALILVGIILQFVRPEHQKVPDNAVVSHYREQLNALADKVKQNPDNATAHREYAVALYVTGDLERAKKQYTETIRLNDKDATLHNNLANVYRDLKEYDKAASEYEMAIKLDPKLQNAYVNLASMQMNALSRADEAIATYRRAIKAMPENVQLNLLLGLAYEQKGDTKQAIQTFKTILAKDADNKAAKSNLDRLQNKN